MPRSAMMGPFLLLSAGPALSQAVTGDAAAALLYPPSPAEVEINGQGVLPKDPFVSIDVDGVGQLVSMAAERGRAARDGLKLGICGEHGGDPASITFCHQTGLDYVSCSPFRVPIARLAAAQAALGKAAASQA